MVVFALHHRRISAENDALRAACERAGEQAAEPAAQPAEAEPAEAPPSSELQAQIEARIAELTDDPAGALADALHTLPIRSVSYIHVRGGRRPPGDGVRRVRRAAKGTPIRLPPAWELDDDA